MQPATIIEQFNVAGNLLPRDLTGWELLTVNELNFERTIRRFREGIVVTNTGPSHRLANIQALQHVRELVRGVITASVRVKPDPA